MADEQNNQKEIPKIRTFKTDVEEFARDKKISPLEAIAKTYASRDWSVGAKQVAAPRTFLIGALAIIFLTGASYLIFNFFKTPAKSPAAPQTAPIVNFIPIENEKPLVVREINPGALLKALESEAQKPLRPDTVIYFPIEIETKSGEHKTAHSADFIKMMNWQPPANFSGNLLPDFNNFVVYSQQGGNLAVIFKVKNFESALSALLSWEPAMWQDLKPFLQSEDVKNVSQFNFHDDIIKNNDARVFKNSQNKIILAYAIFNHKYVIVSTSRDALSTILERLIALPPR